MAKFSINNKLVNIKSGNISTLDELARQAAQKEELAKQTQRLNPFANKILNPFADKKEVQKPGLPGQKPTDTVTTQGPTAGFVNKPDLPPTDQIFKPKFGEGQKPTDTVTTQPLNPLADKKEVQKPGLPGQKPTDTVTTQGSPVENKTDVVQELAAQLAQKELGTQNQPTANEPSPTAKKLVPAKMNSISTKPGVTKEAPIKSLPIESPFKKPVDEKPAGKPDQAQEQQAPPDSTFKALPSRTIRRVDMDQAASEVTGGKRATEGGEAVFSGMEGVGADLGDTGGFKDKFRPGAETTETPKELTTDGAAVTETMKDVTEGAVDKLAGFKDTGKPGEKPTEQRSEREELLDRAIKQLLESKVPGLEEERAAMQGDIARQRAEAIQSTRARTGLGGMGLTGAAGAMEGQVRAVTAREGAKAMGEFERGARQEQLARQIAGIEAEFGSQAAQRAARELGIREEVYGIEKDLMEKELDKDINGDGFIGNKKVGEGGVGDQDPDNNEEAPAGEPPEGYDPYDPPEGTLVPPTGSDAWKQGYNADPATVDYYESLPDAFTTGTHTRVDSYVDEQGNYWYVAINPDGQYYRSKWGSVDDIPDENMSRPRSNTNRRGNTGSNQNALDRAKAVRDEARRRSQQR